MSSCNVFFLIGPFKYPDLTYVNLFFPDFINLG